MSSDAPASMEADDLWLRLDNQLCFALYAANRAVTAEYRELLADLDLTYPQYLVMLVLWEAERSGQVVKISDLGQRLRLDTGTLTPLLKRMAGHGLLERRRDQQDERIVTLHLTASGSALRESARSVPRELVCRAGMEREQLVSLRQTLYQLLEHLEKVTDHG